MVRTEHKIGRLEAELASAVWADPVKVERSNAHGLRRTERERVDETKDALERILERLAGKRDAVTPADTRKLAKLLSSELKRPVSRRLLYRSPYRAMWDPDGVPSLGDEDGAATFSMRARLSRRHLKHRLKRARISLAALLQQRRGEILAESLDYPEDWTPLAAPMPRLVRVQSLSAQ